MEMTIEALLPETKELYDYLDRDVELFQKISRRVLNDMNSENFIEKYKRDSDYTKYIRKHYNVLTRTANSIVRSQRGRYKALVELKKEEKQELYQRIKTLEEDIQTVQARVDKLKNLAKNHKISPKQMAELRRKKKTLHEWKLKLERMRNDFEKLKKQIKSGHIPMTFGGKKQFKGQFHLEESGYLNMDEWRKAHDFALNHNIFYIGRIDEKCGNQIVQLTPEEDGSFSLKLNIDLPFRKEGEPKFIKAEGIRVRYCGDLLRHYLKATTKETGKRPITYRFHKRENGKWYLQIIFDSDDVKPQTDPNNGVVAIDYNDGFLAVAELDNSGNIKSLNRVDLNYHGTGGRALAEIRDVCNQIAVQASKLAKPVVVEKFDLKRTKARLRQNKNKAFNKLIHNFDYSRFIETMERACIRQAVGFSKVNPAYTTKIGFKKYSELRKLNIHFSAALVIGRRFMGFKDSVL